MAEIFGIFANPIALAHHYPDYPVFYGLASPKLSYFII